MAIGVAIASLVVAVVGTAVNIDQGKRAARRQERAADVQQSQQIADTNLSKRRQLREQRIRRARVLQASQNTGVSGSTGEEGVLGGLATQTFSNIAFGQGQTRSANTIGKNLAEARNAQSKAQVAGAVTDFSNSVFQASGGFNTIFNYTDSFGNSSTGGGAN